jgi:hypothetical protein
MTTSVELEVLDGEYAVTLLSPDQRLPGWVNGPGFVNVSFCSDELSIVTPADRVPDGVKSDAGWRAVKFAGQFDFDPPGIVLSVVKPISEVGLAVFVISTFHRDYMLVRAADFGRVRALLAAAGHRWS